MEAVRHTRALFWLVLIMTASEKSMPFSSRLKEGWNRGTESIVILWFVNTGR